MTIYTIIDGEFFSAEVSEDAFQKLLAAKRKVGRPRKLKVKR